MKSGSATVDRTVSRTGRPAADRATLRGLWTRSGADLSPRRRARWVGMAFNVVLTLVLIVILLFQLVPLEVAVRHRIRPCAAGQPPEVGRAAGAVREARRQRHPGGGDDLRGRRVHRNPRRHRDDHRDGARPASASIPDRRRRLCSPSSPPSLSMPLSLVFTPDALLLRRLPGARARPRHRSAATPPRSAAPPSSGR